MTATEWPLVQGDRVAEPPRQALRRDLLIAGQWVAAKSGERIQRISPAYGVEVGNYALAGQEDVDLAIAAARKAFDQGPWPRMKGAQRAAVLRKVADGIEARLEELALLEVLESGKPISQARGEIAAAADIWHYAASLARNLHGDSYNNLGDARLGIVLREPIGVVSMITPWNFPFLIISQKLPFALAAGCTAVVKPSELTSGTTLILAELLLEAGLPEGVANFVVGLGRDVGQRMVSHPDVDMISFTGSTRVGKAAVAASAETLKKVSMELGGKNPQIVFADADLEAALDAVVFGVYFNAGECCNSGSRLLVQDAIADEFIDAVIQRSRQVPVGDPLNERTKVGAIISEAHMATIQRYIEGAQADGAELRLGGHRIDSDTGFYLAPTVMDRVQASMTIAREEVFGPALAVIRFKTLDEALAIANDSLYGLSAGVWSRDMDTCLTAARRIHAGTVWLNTFMDGESELPFGGYRQSGLGRELGRFATEDYTETKTLHLHLGPRTAWWLPA